jgi:hypothetical protein
MIVSNRESASFDIISEHPDRYEECSAQIVEDINLQDQVISLYTKYLDLDSDYIRFIHMKPYIKDKILVIPYYCLIPFNSYDFKNSYPIPITKYAQYIPDIRQIINTI